MGNVVDLFNKKVATPTTVDTGSPKLPQGKEALLYELLEKGLVQIQVDATRAGVKVPAHHERDTTLALNLSWKFDPPDLKINSWGIRSTLSFSGTKYCVAIPWSAVYRIGSVIWTEECPVSLTTARVPVAPLPFPEEHK
jgi:stringent starvation protein B